MLVPFYSYLVVYGTDYKGQTCGVDEPVKDMKYIVYPRTNEDFLVNLTKDPSEYTFYGICAASCPAKLDVVCNYEPADLANIPMIHKTACLDGTSAATDTIPGTTPARTCQYVMDSCWILPEATSSVLYRCVPVYEANVDITSACEFPNNTLDPWDPQCITIQTTTTTVLNRPAQPSFLFDQLNTARQIWGRWFGDLARSWWVILLCAVGVALVLGFTWITFIKYFTSCMVWSTIILTLLLISCLTGYFYYRAGLITYDIPESWADKMSQFTEAANIYIPHVTNSGTLMQDWDGESGQNTKAYRALAYASTGVVFILLAIIVAIRNSIKKAVAVIGLGSDALKALPMTLFFPITNTIALGVFLVWWVYVAASLATAGEITTQNIADSIQAGVAAFEEKYGVTVDPASIVDVETAASINAELAVIKDIPVMNYLVIYHIFSLLWAVQFIQGVAALTIAGAVAGWYSSRKFTTNDPNVAAVTYKQSRFPIFSSLRRTIFNHLGTVAVGSFLIALIQFIRIVAAYLTKKMEPAAKQNSMVRFLLCCVHCFLKCLQAIVEIVTRNAYIFTALKGDSFFRAGRRVFSLISNHGKTFVVVNVLGEIIMFLGKLLVSGASAFAAYLIFNYYKDFQPGGKNQLSSTWLPVLVTLFFAYAVSSGFMMVSAWIIYRIFFL